MGTFIGHFDEAVFFIGLALWWAYRMFKDYVEARHAGKDHMPRISYDAVIRGRRIPLEVIIKIGFTSFGIFSEMPTTIFGGSFGFIEDDGRFMHMNKLAHVTIYAMFLFQAITDLFDWLQWRTIKGLPYITVIQALLWYTLTFYYNFQGTDVDPLELMLHVLSLYLMMGAALSAALEYYFEVGILPQLCRTFFILTLGTWYIHVAAVLFNISRPNTVMVNPSWDRNDPMNVHFMVSMLGLHLLFNGVLLLGIYAGIFTWYKRKGLLGKLPVISMSNMSAGTYGRATAAYEKVSLLDDDQEEEM